MQVAESLSAKFKSAGVSIKTASDLPETTDFDSYKPYMVIAPYGLDELGKAVSLLKQAGISFHVVSGGHNWGYGDSNLNSGTKVLLQLENLNQIENYNPELGTVVINPGVTQEQLAQFLKEKDSPWVLDVTGADKKASIMGNHLERGFGHTAFGDHESHSKILEVLTPDGKVFCPHFMSSGDSKITGLYQHDLALNLEKIFYQTNFAIVTKMQLRLKPKNQLTGFCIVFLKTDEDLNRALKDFGNLKTQRVINAIPHIANGNRVQKTGGKKDSLGAQWVATIDISGPEELVNARRKIIRRTFSSHRMLYFSKARVNFLLKIRKFLFFSPLIKEQIENLGYLLNLYSGIPVNTFVEKTLGSLDGSKRKMNWLCPVFPVTEGHFLKVKDLIETNFKTFGFNYSATLSLVSDRCCVMIAEIIVNSDDPFLIKKAEQCYRKCHDDLVAAGYPFYRYGLRNGQNLKFHFEQNPEYLKVYLLLKRHFDPKNLLSRGRWGLS